ncbi:MAG: hypothetical protein V2J42_14930 [Wenzhouxiangella sp.]|jgi:photosystem II stability/assembly factor-like uncharacterized protein|nr:hypothetical protein [Wenzhouxiangella sp.]
MSKLSAVAVLIGTRKGLFIARSNPDRQQFSIEGPHIAGYEIQRAFLDPRSHGRCGYAAAHHPIWGIHIYRTDNAGRDWRPMDAVPSHGDDDDSAHLKTIWSLAPGPADQPETLYAGIEPPGLFVSRDAGKSWSCLEGFHRHPTAKRWHPAKGGCAVHSLAASGHRLYAALAAGGTYRSNDAGASWAACNAGIRAPYLAERNAPAGHNDHTLRMHPANPDRLYRQSHSGTWRSDDGGVSWHEITGGLPSDFGYALGLDPADPDTLFTIPEASSQFRATVDGKLRVYRTENAGADWQALTDGLPQKNCFVTVLRDGLDTDGLAPLGVYFGTSSGQVYASNDRGETWQSLPAILPPILSVQAGGVA